MDAAEAEQRCGAVQGAVAAFGAVAGWELQPLVNFTVIDGTVYADSSLGPRPLTPGASALLTWGGHDHNGLEEDWTLIEAIWRPGGSGADGASGDDGRPEAHRSAEVRVGADGRLAQAEAEGMPRRKEVDAGFGVEEVSAPL